MVTNLSMIFCISFTLSHQKQCAQQLEGLILSLYPALVRLHLEYSLGPST